MEKVIKRNQRKAAIIISVCVMSVNYHSQYLRNRHQQINKKQFNIYTQIFTSILYLNVMCWTHYWLFYINVREYLRGNHKWTIQINWQHRVHKTKTNRTKTQHNRCWNSSSKSLVRSFRLYEKISEWLIGSRSSKDR
jgi:hypothetical protein